VRALLDLASVGWVGQMIARKISLLSKLAGKTVEFAEMSCAVF